MGGDGAGGLPLRRQGQPLPDPYTPPARAEGRPRQVLGAARAPAQRRQAGADPLAAAAELQARRRHARHRAGGAAPARHCFEFRHPSWFVADVYALLEEHGVSLALGHDARRELPEPSPVGPFVYLRLHYGARGRGGNYSERELDVWRRRIAAWRSRREVFVYLNNDWQGLAPRNALHLRSRLS